MPVRTHIERPLQDAIIRECMNVTGYKGTKVVVSDHLPMNLHSYWSGGSRDYFWFYRPTTQEVLSVPQNGTMFDNRSYTPEGMPPDILLIQHSIFCGRDMGITIYGRSEAIQPLLPSGEVELSDVEKRVLAATRSYISSARREYSKLTSTQWEAGKAACIARGYLTKAGAITAAGRNAIGDYRV